MDFLFWCDSGHLIYTNKLCVGVDETKIKEVMAEIAAAIFIGAIVFVCIMFFLLAMLYLHEKVHERMKAAPTSAVQQRYACGDYTRPDVPNPVVVGV